MPEIKRRRCDLCGRFAPLWRVRKEISDYQYQVLLVCDGCLDGLKR